jgi:hypothetical protein
MIEITLHCSGYVAVLYIMPGRIAAGRCPRGAPPERPRAALGLLGPRKVRSFHQR